MSLPKKLSKASDDVKERGIAPPEPDVVLVGLPLAAHAHDDRSVTVRSARHDGEPHLVFLEV